MGSYCFHCKKFILASGVVPMILFILASTSGVIFSKRAIAFRDCSSWDTVLAPINAVEVCLNLIHQAIDNSVKVVYRSFSAYCWIYFKDLTIFSDWYGVKKNCLYKSAACPVSLLPSSLLIPFKCFPVKNPPAKGLQLTSP